MSDRIEQLKTLLEAEPDDAFCLYGLGLEYSKAGDYDNAVAYFDQTIDTNPDYCYAYYHKARALEERGMLKDAAATLHEGLGRAKAVGDAKAEEEMQALLDSLE